MPDTLSYLIFIIVLLVSLLLDFVVFSGKNKEMSIRSATRQYLLWVLVALAYGLYLAYQYNSHKAILYFTSYLTEISLSVDNIFVFVLIISSLKISKQNTGKVLMIGVLVAILLRILFILIGIALIQRFHFILYILGAILIYTGIKLFFEDNQEQEDVREGKVYQFLTRYLRYTDSEPHGAYRVVLDGKVFFTRLFLVVLLIGITDILFAIDSIPAVFAISTDRLVVFSSNIFAVLGLRSLFFILQKMADQFDYLQQGVAVVLVFIGGKMLLELLDIQISNMISLGVIILTIGASLVYSHYHTKHSSPK